MPDDSPVTRAELEAALSGLKSEIIDALERTETNLLTEFHKWAQTYDVRPGVSRTL